MPMLSQLAVIIEGKRAAQLAVSAAAAATPTLDDGVYDCWCDVDVFIRVANSINTQSGTLPTDVTTTNGYKIAAGSIVAVRVAAGRQIGAIAGGAGTFNYHKIS